MKKYLLIIILITSNLYPNCEGDINQDNILDSLDIIATVNYMLNIDSLDDNLLPLIDLNSDQNLDILDVIMLVNLILEENVLCEECTVYDVMCIDIHSVFKQFEPLTIDSNGYYHFPYEPTGQSDSDYGTVYYMTTDPVTRVGWFSPDSFYVEYMGQTFWEPVINYSTYSGNDGQGQQLFYVNSTLLGDTLDIYGYYYYHPDIIHSVKVIIDN